MVEPSARKIADAKHTRRRRPPHRPRQILMRLTRIRRQHPRRPRPRQTPQPLHRHHKRHIHHIHPHPPAASRRRRTLTIPPTVALTVAPAVGAPTRRHAVVVTPHPDPPAPNTREHPDSNTCTNHTEVSRPRSNSKMMVTGRATAPGGAGMGFDAVRRPG